MCDARRNGFGSRGRTATRVFGSCPTVLQLFLPSQTLPLWDKCMKACLSSKNSATNGKRTKRTDEYPTRKQRQDRSEECFAVKDRIARWFSSKLLVRHSAVLAAVDYAIWLAASPRYGLCRLLSDVWKSSCLRPCVLQSVSF